MLETFKLNTKHPRNITTNPLSYFDHNMMTMMVSRFCETINRHKTLSHISIIFHISITAQKGWSHLLKKSLVENFIFHCVKLSTSQEQILNLYQS